MTSEIALRGPDGAELRIEFREDGTAVPTLDGDQIAPGEALRLVAEEQRRQGWKDRHHRPPAAPGELVAPTGIMVIAEVDAGVRLYASRDIPRATFGMEEVDYRTEWKVGSVMKQMLVITRPTLGECLAELARIWGGHDQAQQRTLQERAAPADALGIERGR